MALSCFEYVKKYELNDSCLPNCWIAVRLDGKHFHHFSDVHGFEKPNDRRSLLLMTKAAREVMTEYKDIIMAYGESDEYSFIFDRETSLYNRRSSKLLTGVCSLFTSAFVFHWKEFFPGVEMKYPPSFDGRIVLYPTNKLIRDYVSWRQADCHVNNLYNTTFWALVKHGNVSRQKAEARLKSTLSKDKNEILFSEFNINYNNEPEIFKKGTILVKETIKKVKVELPDSMDAGTGLLTFHCDIIKNNAFWDIVLQHFTT